MLALEGAADPRDGRRACRMPGAGSAPPATGLDAAARATASANWCWPAACAARRSPRCGRTGAPPSSSPASATARSATTGCCARSSRSSSARAFASSAPTSCSASAALPEGPLGRRRGPMPTREADIAHGLAARAGDRRARYRPGGGGAAGPGARRRGDRGHRRADARAAPRCAATGPGGVLVKIAKPGQERRADLPTIGPRTVDARRRERGCAASPSRPARRSSLDRAEVDPPPPTRPGSSSSASRRRERRASAAPFIFIVAGEPSGDVLGARADRGACASAPAAGCASPASAARRWRRRGSTACVPLADLAVMGVAEVLPRAPLILRRVRETVAGDPRAAARRGRHHRQLGLHLARRAAAAPARRDGCRSSITSRRWCGRGAPAAPGAWRAGTTIC